MARASSRKSLRSRATAATAASTTARNATAAPPAPIPTDAATAPRAGSPRGGRARRWAIWMATAATRHRARSNRAGRCAGPRWIHATKQKCATDPRYGVRLMTARCRAPLAPSPVSSRIATAARASPRPTRSVWPWQLQRIHTRRHAHTRMPYLKTLVRDDIASPPGAHAEHSRYRSPSPAAMALSRLSTRRIRSQARKKASKAAKTMARVACASLGRAPPSSEHQASAHRAASTLRSALGRA